MLDLTEQANGLLRSAHGIPLAKMEVLMQRLQQVAKQLGHLEYHVLRYSDQAWLTWRGSDERSWLPAYGHRQDAETSYQELADPSLQIQVIGVLELLFLGLSPTQADGIVFYDEAGDRISGKTVACQALRKLVHLDLGSQVC